MGRIWVTGRFQSSSSSCSSLACPKILIHEDGDEKSQIRSRAYALRPFFTQSHLPLCFALRPFFFSAFRIPTSEFLTPYTFYPIPFGTSNQTSYQISVTSHQPPETRLNFPPLLHDFHVRLGTGSRRFVEFFFGLFNQFNGVHRTGFKTLSALGAVFFDKLKFHQCRTHM